MIIRGLLPIGSVVLLKDSVNKLMIAGVYQFQQTDTSKLWQYVGVLYPQGFLDPDSMYLFNADQIDRVYMLGYQDEEHFAFIDEVTRAIEELKQQN
ncbi:MAG: DUF4176 domain-containing protein [Clostridia bacterium]|nr:DUF4176 domain-containing protein [Clostridia bacterium]